MKPHHVALAAFLLLPACDGPAQKAGEKQDEANAKSAGQEYSGEGPNERIGESVDRANRAQQDARAASAEAANKQGESIQRQADIGATRLDEQAKAVRDDAAERARALSTPTSTEQR